MPARLKNNFLERMGLGIVEWNIAPLKLTACGHSNPEIGQRCGHEDIFLSSIFLSAVASDMKMGDRKISSLGLLFSSAAFRRQPLYDIAILVQDFELWRALGVDYQLQARTPLRIRERQGGSLLPGLAHENALRDARGRRVTEFLHGLRLLRSVGHLLNGLKFVYHLAKRGIGSVPHSQTGEILPVAFPILDANSLILPEPIESQQRARVRGAVFLIAIETQTAAFIALLIEEKHSWRPRP